MPKSRLIRFCAYFASTLLLTHCISEDTPSSSCKLDGSGCVSRNGGAKASDAWVADSPLSPDLHTAGGTPANGGATMAGAMATDGATLAGATAKGGATTDSQISTSGGAGGTGGIGTSGGQISVDSGFATDGVASMGGAVDINGVFLAKPGDSKDQSRQYLNLGDMRLIVNKWGSDDLRCNTSLRVFATIEKTLGWTFDRGACGGDKEKPDYPEIEFGTHPFDEKSSLATTPSFSSTSLLPIQIKDINSASVAIDGLDIKIQKASTYNFNFELWLSQKNPVTEPNPGVHAELIAFLGWKDGWDCDKTGNVRAGDRGFNLCHQSDAWAGGKWRYFQFRLDGGSVNTFTGKIDIKALLDWLIKQGYSKDLWITRFEIGSEIDDNTSGTITLKKVTFEVNGQSKSPQFAE